eukprot:3758694-Karenia_brevis.AAC.1
MACWRAGEHLNVILILTSAHIFTAHAENIWANQAGCNNREVIINGTNNRAPFHWIAENESWRIAFLKSSEINFGNACF